VQVADSSGTSSFNTSWKDLADNAWQDVANASSSVAEVISAAGAEAWQTGKEVAHDVSDEWKSITATNSSNSSNHSANHPLPSGSTVVASKSCVTMETPADSQWLYYVAPTGTPCLFGVDERDEGSHCIDQGGDLAADGWCWTDEARRTWGKCTDSCPLSGQAKVLAKKMDKIYSKLKTMAGNA